MTFMVPDSPLPPCVLFEDEHLLVVNKPAGWNTHAPDPFAGEGIYDWLRHRLQRWATLAIVHRLDKETSGVMVFTKTRGKPLPDEPIHRSNGLQAIPPAHGPGALEARVHSEIQDRPRRCPLRQRPVGEPAETRFQVLSGASPIAGTAMIEAEPLTGRTHQIRVHAAEQGMPILGDRLYGGAPAARVFLHAAVIEFAHPTDGRKLRFEAPVDFTADSRASLRCAFIEPDLTDCHRIIHSAADGWPGWYVDRLGDWLLSQAEGELSSAQHAELMRLCAAYQVQGGVSQGTPPPHARSGDG
ncbi:MAG: hypothetical protein HC814_08455 [Rhodobacteraceae bacterium]|nr:hypothetical protein [Paracoccaceae bacterium]